MTHPNVNSSNLKYLTRILVCRNDVFRLDNFALTSPVEPTRPVVMPRYSTESDSSPPLHQVISSYALTSLLDADLSTAASDVARILLKLIIIKKIYIYVYIFRSATHNWRIIRRESFHGRRAVH